MQDHFEADATYRGRVVRPLAITRRQSLCVSVEPSTRANVPPAAFAAFIPKKTRKSFHGIAIIGYSDSGTNEGHSS